MFLMMSRGFRYQTSYVAVFHSGSRVSGTWILDRKFRPICGLFFFKLFYSNFIAFKLTFIQFNSPTLLFFSPYLQTSKEGNVSAEYIVSARTHEIHCTNVNGA